jgi:hypothetical protein
MVKRLQCRIEPVDHFLRHLVLDASEGRYERPL